MLGYMVRRLVSTLVVLLGLSILSFAMVRLVPGDTATALLGLQQDPAVAAQLRERLRLDEPVVVQYAVWLGGVLRGDLGTSVLGRPVSQQIAEVLPVTVQLAGMALGLAVGVGVPLGLLGAARRGGLLDAATGAVSVLGLSVPGFWAGTLLILGASLWLGWLPSGGYVPVGEGLWANLRHMVMPSLALGLAVLAVLARTTRGAAVEAMTLDHVRTARAKGLGRWAVLRRHVLPVTWPAVLTILGLQVGYLLGGSIVIERVFSLNGLGDLVLRSLQRRDYPVLQAAVLLIGGTFVVVNLMVDLLLAAVDPRTRGAG
jgi:peptide/nickel transport system permease protein